jgi:hypothetical protein
MMLKFFKRKVENVTYFPKNVTDPNKFAKVLIMAIPHGIGTILNHTWEITQTGVDSYHIIGNHPVGGRIDKMLNNIIIQ